MVHKIMKALAVLVLAFAMFAGTACSKSDAEKCAAGAKKCVKKAQDESEKELAGECQKGLDNGKKWAKRGAECYDKVGDCGDYLKCVRE